MKINQLHGYAYQHAIEETITRIYIVLGVKFTYKKDFYRIHRFAEYFNLEFDENGDIPYTASDNT